MEPRILYTWYCLPRFSKKNDCLMGWGGWGSAEKKWLKPNIRENKVIKVRKGVEREGEGERRRGKEWRKGDRRGERKERHLPLLLLPSLVSPLWTFPVFFLNVDDFSVSWSFRWIQRFRNISKTHKNDKTNCRVPHRADNNSQRITNQPNP